MPEKIDTSDRYFLLGFSVTMICRHGNSGRWWEDVVVGEDGLMTVETFMSFSNVKLLEPTAREICQLVESQSTGGSAWRHRFATCAVLPTFCPRSVSIRDTVRRFRGS